MNLFIHNLKHALMVTVFVFVMMEFIDYLSVFTQGRLNKLIKRSRFLQYIVASFLGATPGCLGAFMSVSLYVHGLISFGAITGCMIATSGDEAFVMLAMFPKKALLLFFILFILGIIFSYFVDKIVAFLKIQPSLKCDIPSVHPQEACACLSPREMIEHLRKMSFTRFLILLLLGGALLGFILGVLGPQEWSWKKITFVALLSLAIFIVLTSSEHYLEEHIWKHIIKKHLLRVFIWTFFALLVVDIGLKFWNLKGFIKSHIFSILFIAVILGILPESGPHLIFVTMFSKGLIPFSVLLANSIVQDGHGMLPLLSYSLRDSFLIKFFNLLIGLGVGLVFYLLGL
ncbi:MAG: selenocysteine protein [Candidatus Omnitrophica bacterium 4484_70.1]|nr:MAG: selenocysteine protein [Candidatus Omnitrophica bacterium 4484_70.1]